MISFSTKAPWFTALTFALAAAAIAAPVTTHAKIKSETVEYKEGDTVLEGYVAYDDAKTGKRPGVLVVHEWLGLNEYAKRRAREMAEMGYVGFAPDIYGKGIRPQTPQEAGQLAGKYKGDRALLRARVNAGYKAMLQNPKVDAQKTMAIGFCFGGTTVLELARSGTPLLGVVSFHGGLSSPQPADAKNIKSKVLVLHGAVDPNVKPDEVQAFQNEMDAAKVDYQLVSYANTVHAFTNPEAGSDPSKGAAYNALSEQRSIRAMKDFFAELLKTKN